MPRFVVHEEAGELIVAIDGHADRHFPLTEDLAGSYALIERLNQCATDTGRKLYAAWEQDGVFHWALYQEWLFWAFVRPLLKYREFLTWLNTEPSAEVETQIPDLDSLLLALRRTPAYRPLRPATAFDWWRDRAELGFLSLNNWLVGIWMRWAGIRGLIFAAVPDANSNRNFRLRDICDGLVKDGPRYVQSFVFSGFKSFLAFHRRFPEPVLYLPHAQYLHRSLLAQNSTSPRLTEDALQRFEPELRPALQLIVEHLAAHLEANRAWERFVGRDLAFAGVQWIAGIDDHTAHVAYLAPARKLGIETIAVQTGPFRKLNVGWICPGIPPEYCIGHSIFLVWNDYWQRVLGEISNVYRTSRVLACGHIRPGSLRLAPRPARPPGSPVRVLFAWEFLADPAETAAYVNAMLARGLEVYFKLRPDTPDAVQLRFLPEARLHLLRTFTEETLHCLDVCAGTFTTVMYELHHLGLPLWYFPMSHDFGHRIAADGIARQIDLAMLNDPQFDPRAHLPSLGDAGSASTFGDCPAPVFLSRHLRATYDRAA